MNILIYISYKLLSLNLHKNFLFNISLCGVSKKVQLVQTFTHVFHLNNLIWLKSQHIYWGPNVYDWFKTGLNLFSNSISKIFPKFTFSLYKYQHQLFFLPVIVWIIYQLWKNWMLSMRPLCSAGQWTHQAAHCPLCAG